MLTMDKRGNDYDTTKVTKHPHIYHGLRQAFEKLNQISLTN